MLAYFLDTRFSDFRSHRLAHGSGGVRAHEVCSGRVFLVVLCPLLESGSFLKSGDHAS